VNRFLDLTSEEVSDLWLTAKYVGQKLEPFYNASSLTFTIQVCMHIPCCPSCQDL
jgi:bis(5'-adenosyl)-triphosphatase